MSTIKCHPKIAIYSILNKSQSIFGTSTYLTLNVAVQFINILSRIGIR